MNALAKKEIETQLADRLGYVFARLEKPPADFLASGIDEVDRILGGFPRGSITEIHGSASCGRTSLLLAALAAATCNDETCAVIDCSDTFDLLSATRAGVLFEQLLWVRCHSNLEHAFKATDLLLHGGGFGLIILSLADMPARSLRRIVSTWWFRFRRAIENAPTVLLVLAPVSCVRSCASVALELHNKGAIWNVIGNAMKEDLATQSNRSSTHLSLVRQMPHAAIAHAQVLNGLNIHVNRTRPLMLPYQPIGFIPQLTLTMFADIR